MNRHLSFAVPLACSLLLVGHVFWHAVWSPFDAYDGSTRMALETTHPATLRKTTRQLAAPAEVTIFVRYDKYPEDIHWTLKDESNTVLAEHKGNKTDAHQERTINLQVPAGTYEFLMTDDHGDGLCCRPGDFSGHYEITVNSQIIAIGGEFADSTGPIEFQTFNGGNVKKLQETNLGLQPDCEELHPGNFNICLYLTTRAENFGNEWLPAFRAAKKKWETIIVDDYTEPTSFKHNLWQRPKTLDGVFITGQAAPIDGEMGILGSSGPRTMVTSTKRNPVNHDRYFQQTLTGEMTFDSADIGRMLREKTYKDVIVHEMGHVLGLGTMWEYNGLHSGRDNDPKYHGVNAQREYTKLGFPGALEVEVDHGEGTAGGHWDEECLRSEIMTGLADPEMQFSTITVAGMEDLGYKVDYSAADKFQVPQDADCDDQDPKHPIKNVRLLHGRDRRRRLSHKGRDAAISYGELEMERSRQRHEKLSLPKNVVFIGDRLRHVLVEEDGHIYAVEVRGKKDAKGGKVQVVDPKESSKVLATSDADRAADAEKTSATDADGKSKSRPLKLWGLF